MKNFNSAPVPTNNNETTQELARKEISHEQMDSITSNQEIARIKAAYSDPATRERLVNNLRSNEFALIAAMKGPKDNTFWGLFKAYNNDMKIYEIVFEKPYPTQLEVETGEKEYTDELAEIH